MQQANHYTVTTGKIMTVEELDQVQGRPWDDVPVSFHNWLQHFRNSMLTTPRSTEVVTGSCSSKSSLFNAKF